MIRQSTDSTQRKQGILLALRGKRPDPDVMLLDVAWIGQIAASNWLEPLESYEINRQDYFASIIDLADTFTISEAAAKHFSLTACIMGSFDLTGISIRSGSMG